MTVSWYIREIWTQTSRQKEAHVNVKAGLGVMLLQAKGHQRWWPTRSWGRGLDHIRLSQPSEGTNPAPPWPRTSGLQNRKVIHFCLLNHPAWGPLLWQPWQTHTLGKRIPLLRSWSPQPSVGFKFEPQQSYTSLRLMTLLYWFKDGQGCES